MSLSLVSLSQDSSIGISPEVLKNTRDCKDPNNIREVWLAEAARLADKADMHAENSRILKQESRDLARESERLARESGKQKKEGDALVNKGTEGVKKGGELKAAGAAQLAEAERLRASASAKFAEADRLKASADAKQAAADAKYAAADAKQIAADAKHAAAGAKRSTADAKQAEAEAMQVSADEKRAAADKARVSLLAKRFFQIFNGKTELPEERYVEIFQAYVAGQMIVEKNANLVVFKMSSLDGVIAYLHANPETKVCNLALINEIAENQIQRLAECLKSIAVSTVAFKSTISEADKGFIADAVATRSTTAVKLKVQYA